MDKLFVAAVLWIVHFLKSPEGHQMLDQLESEILDNLESSLEGNQVPPPAPNPVPGAAAAPQSAQQSWAKTPSTVGMIDGGSTQ